MEHRTTVVEFNIEPTKLFDIVQGWAQQWGFSVYEQQKNRVFYSKRIRHTKAWLCVENRDGKGKIEAWIAAPNLGPDFKGNAWRGWKVALPRGFSFGPLHIYRKKFNDLLKQITEKFPDATLQETIHGESSSVIASAKPPLAPALAVYGIFLIITGALGLLSAASLIYMRSFPDLANHTLIGSSFDIVVGSLIFASSKALAKGKTLAVWLYGLSMMLEISSQLITGEKLNYFFIVFGIYALWNIFQATKRQTNLVLATTD